jgi:hypothetical protein
MYPNRNSPKTNTDHPEGGFRAVEYFNNLGTMTTYYIRRRREITSRTVMTTATFNEKNPFFQQIGLRIKEETIKLLPLPHSCLWC